MTEFQQSIYDLFIETKLCKLVKDDSLITEINQSISRSNYSYSSKNFKKCSETNNGKQITFSKNSGTYILEKIKEVPKYFVQEISQNLKKENLEKEKNNHYDGLQRKNLNVGLIQVPSKIIKLNGGGYALIGGMNDTGSSGPLVKGDFFLNLPSELLNLILEKLTDKEKYNVLTQVNKHLRHYIGSKIIYSLNITEIFGIGSDSESFASSVNNFLNRFESKPSPIKSITFNKSRMGKELFEGVPDFVGLKHLDMSNCLQVNDEYLRYMTANLTIAAQQVTLSKNIFTNLESLILSNCGYLDNLHQPLGITDQTIDLLISNNVNHTLKNLDLSSSFITFFGLEKILISFNKLESLNLSSNDIMSLILDEQTNRAMLPNLSGFEKDMTPNCIKKSLKVLKLNNICSRFYIDWTDQSDPVYFDANTQCPNKDAGERKLIEFLQNFINMFENLVEIDIGNFGYNEFLMQGAYMAKESLLKLGQLNFSKLSSLKKLGISKCIGTFNASKFPTTIETLDISGYEIKINNDTVDQNEETRLKTFLLQMTSLKHLIYSNSDLLSLVSEMGEKFDVFDPYFRSDTFDWDGNVAEFSMITQHLTLQRSKVIDLIADISNLNLEEITLNYFTDLIPDDVLVDELSLYFVTLCNRYSARFVNHEEFAIVKFDEPIHLNRLVYLIEINKDEQNTERKTFKTFLKNIQGQVYTNVFNDFYEQNKVQIKAEIKNREKHAITSFKKFIKIFESRKLKRINIRENSINICFLLYFFLYYEFKNDTNKLIIDASGCKIRIGVLQEYIFLRYFTREEFEFIIQNLMIPFIEQNTKFPLGFSLIFIHERYGFNYTKNLIT